MKKSIVISKTTDDLIKKTALKESITQSQLIEILLTEQLNAWDLIKRTSNERISIITMEIPKETKIRKTITLSKSTNDRIKAGEISNFNNESTVIEMLVLQQLEIKYKKKPEYYESDIKLPNNTN